jgi:hypothetical protein
MTVSRIEAARIVTRAALNPYLKFHQLIVATGIPFWQSQHKRTRLSWWRRGRVELHLNTYLRGLPSAMDLVGVELLVA